MVVRPNADTLYSTAWLELSKEPILLKVPDTHGRYYVMQLLDAWTETFGMSGKRTDGTGRGRRTRTLKTPARNASRSHALNSQKLNSVNPKQTRLLADQL